MTEKQQVEILFSIRYDIQDAAARRCLETAYPAGTADMLAEYAEELFRMPEKACEKGGADSPFMRTIPGIYRQIDPEYATAEKVRLPPGARPMAGKTGAEKGLEEIKAMRTRVIAERPEMSALSEEEKERGKCPDRKPFRGGKVRAYAPCRGRLQQYDTAPYKGVSVAEEEQEESQWACG